MSRSNMEARLIDSIQPIRQFALATCIYHLFESNVYDALRKKGPLSLQNLVEQCHVDEAKLATFLKYLRNEGIVAEHQGSFRLTDDGVMLEPFRPWYTLLIGGYGETFLQIGDKLRQDSGWATRDLRQVGIGSCGISHYDAIPLTRLLMDRIPGTCRKLLDLGCGNGRYLVEFCKALPHIEAMGVEPHPGSASEARQLIAQERLDDRVQVICSGALEFFEHDISFQPDFLVLGFVLHEILGQEGEAGVMLFLSRVIARFPNIHIIVIEVDLKIDEPEIMQHGLSLGYYNPYYLLHSFTQQQLAPLPFWETLFSQCNLTILAQETADHWIDSTDLEVGYLLKARN